VNIEILNQIGINSANNFMDRLCSLIEIGDVDAIHLTMKELNHSYKNELMKESEVKVLVIHNMVLLHSVLQRRYESKKENFPNFEKFIDGIKRVESLEGLLEMVADYCEKATLCIGASTTDVVVKRMIAYIEKNYDQDLKLEGIAKIFNYNSAYLGKVFKKEMGESFNNVLDTIRIENAKRLLLESNLKVYQVSKQVGYSNIDYFYSKFKKNVGISPKEYKHK
jgi:two-component system response regulator YesN